LRKGLSYASIGRYDEAVAIFNKILADSPDDKEALLCKAGALSRMGSFAKALESIEKVLECYEAVIKLDPEYPKAWYNKGVVLSDIRLYNEALRCYEEVLRINPGVAVVWTNKGYCLAMLNRYEEALECLDRALDINPEDLTALGNKAAALRRLGRDEEAAEYDEKVKELMITRGPHTVI